MKEERSTKVVTVMLTATFHGDYLGADEVAGYLERWVYVGLDDRDDLRGWKLSEATVVEVPGDPNGYDTEVVPDWVCVSGNGNEYAEHDFNEVECRRCGAEPES